MGEQNNRSPQKYDILGAMARRPDMSAREASRLFGVNRHTIEKWCREAGISLDGHKHPRVGQILAMKQKKRKRLIVELAQLERDIKALSELDPNSAYRKPKARKS